MSIPSANAFLQPSNLRPANHVIWSEIASQAPSFIRFPKSGRRKLGVQYEQRVHLHLQTGLLPHQLYWTGPWFRFLCKDETKARWCQPDGLLFDVRTGVLTIVEVKYQHTADSWWWIQRLYLPVVRSIFPPNLWRYQRLEIVHTYDPATKCPEKAWRIKSLSELDPLKFCVLIVKEMCYE